MNIGKTVSTASLKYLDNFDHPYVKIILVCKICNKEQNVKATSNWRAHYLTHSAEKPHKCESCGKSFIRADRLRNHMAKCSNKIVKIEQSPFENGPGFL